MKLTVYLLRGLILISLLLPMTAHAEKTIAVPVSAINYTDQELNSFVFSVPDNPRQAAGGPSLLPYEGGGTMCCYSLPKKWRPGIKVKLTYDWWQGDDKPRKYVERIFEVPRYPDKTPGMLWALFYEGGEVQVVSSDFDPGHPKWPGKIKHWPEPSLEYKRKLWEEEVERTKGSINNAKSLMSSPMANEELRKTAKANYEFYSERLKYLEANRP